MIQDEFSTGPGKYIILNDGKVNNIQTAIDLGKETGKIFKKNSKKSGIKGWGVATIIAPPSVQCDAVAGVLNLDAEG